MHYAVLGTLKNEVQSDNDAASTSAGSSTPLESDTDGDLAACSSSHLALFSGISSSSEQQQQLALVRGSSSSSVQQQRAEAASVWP